ncbi:cysteine--tRNA ligase [Paenibacillus selenitireducens]|uniref:Cysteine--tRNA ligase n=1 Tax=Paenibacillus selenitireducens TaxID=1324314 RepID=A0A1T2WZZ3_9BACL|nr:cysteine--tRNA ligase [Paenibacillus selenitireducens]OPA73135.1 cysteine--tRNA ligase [Paenibacillus selenitireducens]
MALHLYNTMNRTKELFVPQQSGKVSMYVCGPTVYDYMHIGNARPVIVFDVVRRYLEAIGYEVNYVSNFTDVDDKLIRKAEQMGSTVPEVANQFIQAFQEDIEGLGVRPATVHPRVTDNIPEIIAFIQGLVDQGYAYAKDGDVYFRTQKFQDYGKLSHQNIDELQFGIRIEVDERKENAQDFVLWKGAKPGEIFWSSPWGDGRPGWHIECSAMAQRYLGDTLDIHGGGQDLQFPHHECEIAQSEARTGKSFANYWMHNGYINIDNEKMSKSLGNGITVVELRKRFKPTVLRYFMLAAHYRNPLNFTDEIIGQAENSVARIENAYANVEHRLQALQPDESKTLESVNAELAAKLVQIREMFHTKMQDDFNTADAITAWFDAVSEANQLLKRDDVTYVELKAIADVFDDFNQVLGLVVTETNDLLDEEIENLIAERVEARQTKNWKRADEIRDLLAEKNIILEDTPQGMRWRRK